MDPLLSIIPGNVVDRKSNPAIKDSNIDKHLEFLKLEFIGSPLICYELVKSLVYLRRGINVKENQKLFFELLEKYIEILLVEYNTRWLVSICDTIIDHGSEKEKHMAMLVIVYTNLLKVSGTLFELVNDSEIDQNKRSLDFKKDSQWPVLFDGVARMTMYNEDALVNMHKRINSYAENMKDTISYKIWIEFLQRIRRTQNIITKFESICKNIKKSF